METRRVRQHKTTAVFLAFGLLLLGGTAVVSAAQDLLPRGGLIGGPAAGPGAGGRDAITLTIPIGGLAPGASTRVHQVVENSSDGPLRFALSSSTAEHDGKGVREVVRVTIKTADRSSGAASCDSFDGATLYSGPLGATSAGFGDPRIGGHNGDRLLPAGEREMLCFEIKMPLDAGNEFQGASASSVWTVALEQVAGNS
jgi:hypothetical protein